MARPAPYAVAIVVDPDFGERLRELSEVQHVWAIDSKVNRAAAQQVRVSQPDFSLERGVTIFRADLPESAPEQWLADVVGIVEEHHGRFSHDPPVTILDVYGASARPEIRQVFARYGFTHIVETAEGFRARAQLSA